jgi:prevent-host-death family protein
MTEASARGIARLAREAAEGHPVVVVRHKRPVAVVLGFEEYAQLVEQARQGKRRPEIRSPFQG